MGYFESWRYRWNFIEACIGLVAAFVLSFAPVVAGGLALIFAVLLAEWTVATIATPVVAVSIPTSTLLIRMCHAAMSEFRMDDADQSVPFAVLVTHQLPWFPQFVRVLLFLWWIAHFLAGVVLVGSIDFRNQMGWRGLFDGFGGIALAFCFTFASNLFLILSVAVLMNSSVWVTYIWRHRIALDLLIISPLLYRALAG